MDKQTSRSDFAPGSPEIDIKMDLSWKRQLIEEFTQPYMQELRQFLKGELARGKKIYPKPSDWFAAFDATPFEKVKVVILGQDPYHGPGQAHGLCFSVQPGVPAPPSLLNIFKELKSDLGIERPPSGMLTPWAQQGVLLLNSVLTVEDGKAGAHQNRGWEKFTDKAIQLLNEKRENLVFVLWGAYAQKKGQFIDRKRHFVIESVHPSPLSASRGFMGSRPFSKINAYLEKQGLNPIDWNLNGTPQH
ncbi:MAG TPA: uracil-DNA glycosylase [Bdellovibrionales bacterium]|nr:uracil-DNA glycosylase [Bdellovibrionales bacterium]